MIDGGFLPTRKLSEMLSCEVSYVGLSGLGIIKKGGYSADEKLLVHFFQDSLAGVAVAWYTNLEASQIRSWKDLATAFIQGMTKREHESIKEYAQRWRDLTAQVVPPMTEREMITIMVDTLPTFYYKSWLTLRTSSSPEKGLNPGYEKASSNMLPIWPPTTTEEPQ